MKIWTSISILFVALVAVGAWGFSSQKRCETIEFQPKGVTSATFRDDRGKALVVVDKRSKNFGLYRSAVLAAFGEDRYSSITICTAADVDEKTPVVLREVVLIGEAASLIPKIMLPGVVTYLLFPAGDLPEMKMTIPVGVLLKKSESSQVWENWCLENQIPFKLVSGDGADSIAIALNGLQREVSKKHEGGHSGNLQSPDPRPETK